MSKAAELASLIGNINAGGGGVNRNLVINGDMSISQRSTSVASITGAGYAVLDKHRLGGAVPGTWTWSQSTTVPSGQGFANSMKLDCTATGSADTMYIQHRMEGQNLQGFAKGTSDAKPFSLSFWVRSNKTGTYIATLLDNDNTRHVSKSYTISSANTWEHKKITFPADTSGALNNDNGPSLEIYLWLSANSNNSSGTLATTWASVTNANNAVGQVNLADDVANEWYLTGLQLEVGQNATEFEHEPFATTLHKCERYFQKWDLETAVGTGLWFSANQVLGHLELRQNMCNEPTMSVSSADFVKGYLAAGASDANDSSSPFDLLSTISCRFNLAMVSTGTNGQGCLIQMKASEYIHADAEVGT